MTRRPTMPSGRTILVVDDQMDTLAAMRMLLEREGHRVLIADSGEAALALIAREPVQLMLVDYAMPVMNGEELIREVRLRNSLVQILLHTGHTGDAPPREMLARLPIQGCHDKSDGAGRLLLWVDACLNAHDRLAQLHITERLKTELLANVSHEFRTPLNVIIGYLDLLRDGTFGTCPPEMAKVCDKLYANAGHLLELVGEFLDLSKLEAGAVPVRREAVALGPLLRGLGEAVILLLRGRPVLFTIDLPDDIPAVAADAAKLRVVMQNLLANAAKFTAQGEIRVSARARGDDEVVIHVRDTGPGIAPEHHEAIFELYRQLSPEEGSAQGAGLGLALARRFARVMDGEITVESALGAGTTFTVTLPVFTGNAAGPPTRRLREL